MSDDSDDDCDDDGRQYCDFPWCNKAAKSLSLVMGYTDGSTDHFLWGKGDLVCPACLAAEKKKTEPGLYQVKYCGRNTYCTAAYYDKYRRDDPDAQVVRTPEDHRQNKEKGKKKKRKRGDNGDDDGGEVDGTEQPSRGNDSG